MCFWKSKLYIKIKTWQNARYLIQSNHTICLRWLSPLKKNLLFKGAPLNGFKWHSTRD